MILAPSAKSIEGKLEKLKRPVRYVAITPSLFSIASHNQEG